MGRIIPFSGNPHEQVQALLPWYVNGTLDDAEAANVDAHLAECDRCRAEFEAERKLCGGIASTGLDPDKGWDRVREGIAGGGEAPGPSRRGFLRRRIALGTALAAQIAVAAALLFGAAWLPSFRPEPAYRTLGSAPATAPAANAILLFRADADMTEVRAALASAGARVTGGPTTSGAWLLSIPADTRATALEALRGRASVVLAEPLDAGEPR